MLLGPVAGKLTVDGLGLQDIKSKAGLAPSTHSTVNKGAC